MGNFKIAIKTEEQNSESGKSYLQCHFMNCILQQPTLQIELTYLYLQNCQLANIVCYIKPKGGEKKNETRCEHMQ